MAKDYTGNVATAKRLIKNFGRQVTLRKLSNTASDANKPWLGATDPVVSGTSITVYGVAVPPSSATLLGFSAIPDDLLKTVSQIFILEVGESDPEALDDYTTLVDTDTKEYGILYVEKLRPGETTILYFMGVSR